MKSFHVHFITMIKKMIYNVKRVEESNFLFKKEEVILHHTLHI